MIRIRHKIRHKTRNHPVVTDAFWQIAGRIASALWWLLVIKLITPYLWPLRFGDYSTILKYFAIWSALADFGVYVLALRHLWAIKKKQLTHELQETYEKYVSSRVVLIGIVYVLALVIAYLIPAYTSNPFLVWGLPLGMIFSASFMVAGILQIPLQLHRKMQHVSIALVLARVVQLAIIGGVLVVYPHAYEDPTALAISPFMWILFSVVASGIVQWLYVWWQWYRVMKRRRRWDFGFTWSLTRDHRKYGVAYYLSSFHTLLVMIFLSWYFPTIEWFIYAGTWALALSLIEIFLIVPSALGNSLIHDVAAQDRLAKQQRFGSLLSLVVRIGGFILFQFALWRTSIIDFIGGSAFLSNATQLGSDALLPFLALVLLLSFIKQVFNYIFVSEQLHNKLLVINGIGVTIGVLVGVLIIPQRNLIGGIITQLVLEVSFVVGALLFAYKHNAIPRISRLSLLPILGVIVWSLYIAFFVHLPAVGIWWLLAWGLVSTALLVGVQYPTLKVWLKSLS